MKNPFKRVFLIDTETLISQAFSTAAKEVKKKSFTGPIVEKSIQKEGLRIKTCANVIHSNLKSSVRSFPNIDKLPILYRELLDVTIKKVKLRKILSSINWTANKIKKLQMKYLDKLKRARHTRDSRIIRKEFYGRVASLLKRIIKKDVEYLLDNLKILKNFPDIKDIPTVIITGPPNVGKSSLIARLSKSKPEVQSYPFTTRGIMIGYEKLGRIQYIDIPGLLDRPLKKRNPIEMQGITILKFLGDLIIYIFDISETCGYSLDAQEKLFKEIKNTFKKPIIAVSNKIDIIGGKPVIKNTIPISSKTGKGIDKLKDTIKTKL